MKRRITFCFASLPLLLALAAPGCRSGEASANRDSSQPPSPGQVQVAKQQEVEIQNNTHMPPQAREAALAQIRAQQAAAQHAGSLHKSP